MMVFPACTVRMASERSSSSASLRGNPRTGLYALEDVLVVLVGRQDMNGGLWQEVPDLPGGADTVHLRHGDVHQDHVGFFFAAQLDGLLAVVGDAHHLHLGQHIHEARETSGEQPLVVHDRHTNHNLFVFAHRNSTPLLLERASIASTVSAKGSPSYR
jgi:hypothetical protein